MKKSIILLALLLVISIVSKREIYAAPGIYFDLGGTVMDLGESDQMKFGGTFGAAVALTQSFDLNLAFRFTMATKARDVDVDVSDSYSMSYMQYSVGFEYVHHIFDRLSVRGAVLAGMADLSINYDNSMGGDYEKQDSGAAIGIYPGVVYAVTQHLSAYVDFGYVYTGYSEQFLGSMKHNFQVNLGMRISLFDTKSIDDKY